MIIERCLHSFRQLTKKNESILIACSGGVDSMLLCFVASKLRDRRIVVGHISHNIRSAEETRFDYDLVRDYAKRLKLPFVHESLSLEDSKGSLENAARIARYEALRELSKQEDCQYVATAHHADDHLITVLMHMCRGCGLRGLRGIRKKSSYQEVLGEVYPYGPDIIRPLLHATKEEIVEVALKREVPFLNDSTNADLSIVRNNFAKNVLPALKEHYPKAAQNAVKMSERLSLMKNDRGKRQHENQDQYSN